MVKYGKIEKISSEEHGGHRRRDGGGFSSSSSNSTASSSSDSEYYSPEEIVGKNAKHHKVRRSPKMKTSKDDKLIMFESVITVGEDSASTSTENNLNVGLDVTEYNAAMEKNQQLEKIVSDMNQERQQLFRTLIDEIKDFVGEDKKFSDTGSEEIDFFKLVKEVKNEATAVKFQLESVEKENQEMKKYIEEYKANTTRLGIENGELNAKIIELKNLTRPGCETCDTSKVIYEDTKALQLKIEEMAKQVRDSELKNERLEKELIDTKKDNSDVKILKLKVIDLQRQNENLTNDLEGIHEAKNVLEARVEDQVNQIVELRSEKNKLEEEITVSKTENERLTYEMDAMQLEMETLNRKERELIEQINTIQVERLNDERSKSGDDERKFIEIQAIVKNLETEIDISNKRKTEMEEILNKTNEENSQLKEKSKELENKIHDMERTLAQHKECMKEFEIEITELSAKLSLRDEEFNTLQNQKTQLELKIARDRADESSATKNNNTKDREEKVINGTTSKEFEKIKGWFKTSKPSLQVIDRKMEELVEEFRKQIEDNIRLMSQRIRVTEQLHVENKENYKITKERLEQENRLLETRTSEYLRILSTLETSTTKLKNVAEATQNMLSGLNLLCKQFDERSGRIMNRMSRFCEELQYVKNWIIGTKKVNELLKGEMGGLVEQLKRKEENEGMLMEKILRLLEGRVEMSLMKGMEEVEEKMRGLEGMVKEKEKSILEVCEEKREAIRQLCVLIDYQKNKSDYFKQIIIEKCNVVSSRKC